MKRKLIFSGGMMIVLLTVLLYSPQFLISRPSFNGDLPGCAGSSCHTFTNGVIGDVSVNGMQVQITVSGVSSGKAVAGELVDAAGTVVAVNNGTNNNPFTLTVPQTGDYTVNAGFASPSRKWDSTHVSVGVTGIGDPNQGQVSQSFQLYQNHPNPFNSETILRFSIPETAPIHINIYDVTGRLIRHLADGVYTEGIHSIRWNGKDDSNNAVPTGIYFSNISFNGRNKTMRMIYAR